MLIKLIQKEITNTEKMLETIARFEKNAPLGHLKTRRVKGKMYFGQQFFDKETNRWKSIHINKKMLPLAQSLAQKLYYSKVKDFLHHNLKMLTRMQRSYHPQRLEEEYNLLPEEIQMLIVPLQETVKTRIQKWNAEIYEPNSAMPEHLRYETEQGELVRSKSEMIIANLLYQHRDTILYKYERPLPIVNKGKRIIIHPDFTILEHAGMMDGSTYANDFVWKVNTYMKNDLLPGRDVLFTYESQMYPLELKVLKKTIDILLER